MICNKLVSMMYDRAKERIVTDVRIGLVYTSVLLDNGRCGVASTMFENMGQCCSFLEHAGELTGKSGADLIHFYPSHNPIKAALGLATINALANYEVENKKDGDVLDAINILPEDRIGIVGNFKPIVKEIEKITDSFMVFEKKKIDGKHIFSVDDMDRLLPECTVVLITSTVLVNKTFEPLVELIKNARLCAMVGPSTPLVPEFFSDKNIHILSGVEVTDTENVMKIAGQAGGMSKFKNFVKKVNVFCEKIICK